MFFYLKVNRNEGYTIRNLKHWIDTIKHDRNNAFVIICDNDELRQRILNN